MSYRKLKIDDKEYLYSIGRKFTKIKGGPIFENSKIGSPIAMMFKEVKPIEFIVGPKNVRNAILGLPLPVFRCEKHNVETTELAADPFDLEIHGRKKYPPDCLQCLAARADDI